jgi:hypothetical protein
MRNVSVYLINRKFIRPLEKMHPILKTSKMPKGLHGACIKLFLTSHQSDELVKKIAAVVRAG